MAENQVSVGTMARILLNQVTATGASNVLDLAYARAKVTMQTVVTGAPTTVSCVLQGSLDGVNWTTLATSSSTTGDQQYSVDKPVQYLRVNLATLTGGTSPTVTAIVCSV